MNKIINIITYYILLTISVGFVKILLYDEHFFQTTFLPYLVRLIFSIIFAYTIPLWKNTTEK